MQCTTRGKHVVCIQPWTSCMSSFYVSRRHCLLIVRPTVPFITLLNGEKWNRLICKLMFNGRYWKLFNSVTYERCFWQRMVLQNTLCRTIIEYVLRMEIISNKSSVVRVTSAHSVKPFETLDYIFSAQLYWSILAWSQRGHLVM